MFLICFLLYIGLEKEPKYGHLKHLHNALNLCKKALLWGQSKTEKPGKDTEVFASIYVHSKAWFFCRTYIDRFTFLIDVSL